jgi:hypothetical protein
MTAKSAVPGNGVSILDRLIRPGRKTLPVTAARALLAINFEESDRQRMRGLSQKARDGTLSPEEKAEIDSYELVGHLLALLHSKARQALKKRNGGGA